MRMRAEGHVTLCVNQIRPLMHTICCPHPCVCKLTEVEQSRTTKELAQRRPLYCRHHSMLNRGALTTYSSVVNTTPIGEFLFFVNVYLYILRFRS